MSGDISTRLTAFLENFRISSNAIIKSCASLTVSSDTSFLGFCRGSASVSRGFVSVETQSQCESTAAVVDAGRTAPLMGDQCHDSMSRV